MYHKFPKDQKLDTMMFSNSDQKSFDDYFRPAKYLWCLPGKIVNSQSVIRVKIIKWNQCFKNHERIWNHISEAQSFCGVQNDFSGCDVADYRSAGGWWNFDCTPIKSHIQWFQNFKTFVLFEINFDVFLPWTSEFLIL